MKALIERSVYIVAIVGLTGALVAEARTQVGLERATPVESQALYDAMAEGFKVQIVDMRPLVDDENLDVGGYEYTHIPKSIPVPGCDPTQAPEGAMAQIQLGAPTVIVSAEGDAADYEQCATVFRRARNLEGGMLGWQDNFLPEDEGEYTPPSIGGGGGCL